MALFTALHRVLGRPPGELSDDMVDEAVTLRVAETDDLDWKKELPPSSGLPKTDFPKDIAAMANSGGGVIVYGVEEEQKEATGRADTGVLTENHERTLRKATYNAITPPVFGVRIYRLGDEGQRAVVVVVPPSTETPHLVYRDDLFGAPIRNDADTEWLKERQIDAMYRDRHQEQKRSHDALVALYEGAAAGGRSRERAWLIGAARPRIPIVGQTRITQEEATTVFRRINYIGSQYIHRVGREWPRPSLALDDSRSARPGLRSWIAPPKDWAIGSFEEASASVHDDGSITLATPAGGYRLSLTEDAAGYQCRTETLETFTADLMALLRLASELRGANDYELIVGIEWHGDQHLTFEQKNNSSFLRHVPAPLPIAHFSRVETTVRPDTDDNDYLGQVRDLATDLVNQTGFQHILLLEDVAQERS